MRCFERPPVLNRLGHMRDLHALSAGQVGNGAGNFQAAVNAPARPAQPRRHHIEESGHGRRVELALRIDRLAFERLVGAALADHSAFPCLHHAAADGVACFAGRHVYQFIGGQAADFDMQVNPVEQRPALGYPACPDHSVKKELLELLRASDLQRLLAPNL